MGPEERGLAVKSLWLFLCCSAADLSREELVLPTLVSFVIFVDKTPQPAFATPAKIFPSEALTHVVTIHLRKTPLWLPYTLKNPPVCRSMVKPAACKCKQQLFATCRHSCVWIFHSHWQRTMSYVALNHHSKVLFLQVQTVWGRITMGNIPCETLSAVRRLIGVFHAHEFTH